MIFASGTFAQQEFFVAICSPTCSTAPGGAVHFGAGSDVPVVLSVPPAHRISFLNLLIPSTAGSTPTVEAMVLAARQFLEGKQRGVLVVVVQQNAQILVVAGAEQVVVMRYEYGRGMTCLWERNSLTMR